MKILDLLQKTMIMGTGGGDEVNPLLEFKTRFFNNSTKQQNVFFTGDGDTGTGSFFDWNNGTEMRTLKFNIIIIYNILYIIIILN